MQDVKNRQKCAIILRTVSQIRWAIYSQLKHVSTIEGSF